MILKENYVKYRFFNAALCLLICVAFLSSCAIDMGTKAGVINTQNSRVLLYVYMDATPSSNFNLEITSSSLVSIDGVEVFLQKEPIKTTSDELKSKQVLIAGEIVPSAYYNKLLIEVNGVQVEIPLQIKLKKSETEVINLQWQLDKQQDDVPLFKAEYGLRDLAVKNTMLVSHIDSDYISIIDTSTLKVVDAITVCNGPSGMDFNRSKNEVMVACSGSNKLVVIDYNNLRVTKEVFANTCSKPIDIIYVEDIHNGAFGKAYLLCEDSNSISFFETLTWKDSSEKIDVGLKPVRFTFNDDRKELYVANSASNDISVVNTSTNSLSQDIAVGNRPVDVIYDEESDKVYVINNLSYFLSVIPVDTKIAEQRTIQSVKPLRMVFSDNEVFIEGEDGKVYFYDRSVTSMNELSLDSYSYAMGYEDSFKHLYVGDNSLQRIKVIDVLQREVIKMIDLKNNSYDVLKFD